ncbi:uncharacterized protein PHACADRAFT_256091 [Phanerochaete carnosa HHB-10118-sp]|uniref:ADF-H domain-containing protein n=1 Tax=Phanerochaete carnosa (strain HHB-10118-sp) TaxID=650164 RepID=K5UZ66_PHACS|nr:uncharacterized protein PHACADRAFT_256091 [Phanerochaete carnosa HHB-10118-sp]EKM55456.1 hypothetical protein PHACADRAFT_256091 [Phanerochaete carnosa HHB-10118-sp]
MSATSGITVSPELAATFSDALTSQSVRFLKVSIHNESLVADQSVAPSGSLSDDLDKLGDILEDDIPAYVLVRLDSPPTEWMAISYVPDGAKVRDKMLYASTRNNLTKALGSAPFTDQMFATSKADITADAYARHCASLVAPKPMTPREREMEEIKMAETRSAAYDGSRARKSHVGGKIGFQWSEESEQAVSELERGCEGKLVVLSIDPTNETLVVSLQVNTSADEIGSSLPTSDPAYAFYAWPQSKRREIVFIYSCPSGSPIKLRMLYSSGMLLVYHNAKNLLAPTLATLVTRKVETSDPKEVSELFLKSVVGPELGNDDNASGSATPVHDDQKGFARPKGPARRR